MPREWRCSPCRRCYHHLPAAVCQEASAPRGCGGSQWKECVMHEPRPSRDIMPGQGISPMSGKPEADEYAAFYEKYIALVPSADVVGALEAQRLQTTQLLSACSERERIFTYRALRIARADATPLSGFEQEDYVRAAGCARRQLREMAEEFAAVRIASIALYRSLDDESWLRRGVANKNEVSVRALAFITAGHELHHRRLLEERYLAAIPRA